MTRTSMSSKRSPLVRIERSEQTFLSGKRSRAQAAAQAKPLVP